MPESAPDADRKVEFELSELWDATLVDQTLHVLGLQGTRLGVWSVEAKGPVTFEVVDGSPAWARFISPNSPRVLMAGPDSRPWIYEEGATRELEPTELDSLAPEPASGLKMGERLVVAFQMATLPLVEAFDPQPVALHVLRLK
jgi:hypothetical protein